MLAPIAPAAPLCDLPPMALSGKSLFFDFDGTLVDLADTPDAVIVDAALIDLLERLAARLPGRMAIISGRAIDQLDRMLGAFAADVAIAGSHGADLRVPGIPHVPAGKPAMLADATAAMRTFADSYGLLLESKSHGVALHYRLAPAMEPVALATAEEIATRTGLTLQHGKMMVELRAPGDKGRAIATLLATPAMAGTAPLFFGDDLTDEAGFAAAASAGGAGILIGEMRTSAALYRLPDVAALRAWMAATLEIAE